MSNKVIDILEYQAHNTGTARCMNCGHEWVAVAPIGVIGGLECPECKLKKGVFVYEVEPEVIWVCNCGCYLFTLSGVSGQWLCWKCGKPHNPPEEED
jgi:DNA-directed RNA polymerase subunit RPC12/RpoP